MLETTQRRKKNSAKTNLVISVVFHAVVLFLLGFWAAHEGALGNKLQEITVAIVPPEKKPEPEREKPIPSPPKIEPPKEEPVKVEAPKPVVAPPPVQTAAAPPQNIAPAMAPPPAQLADFAFSDGAKPVTTGTNAALLAYKGMVEYTLRANWERPTDMMDDSLVAEMELSVDHAGRINASVLTKSSGNDRWDASVKKAVATTRRLNSPPPEGFPPKVLIRFDVLPASTDLNQ